MEAEAGCRGVVSVGEDESFSLLGEEREEEGDAVRLRLRRPNRTVRIDRRAKSRVMRLEDAVLLGVWEEEGGIVSVVVVVAIGVVVVLVVLVVVVVVALEEEEDGLCVLR